MKKLITTLILIFLSFDINAEENLRFFLNKAIENNLQLNAERKFRVTIHDRNISRSEFLPSITLSGDQSSTVSTNRTDQSGQSLADSNSDTENRTISLEQKIFTGFKGVNTFKKSELETQRAKLVLKELNKIRY